jgi:hypothetical protein
MWITFPFKAFLIINNGFPSFPTVYYLGVGAGAEGRGQAGVGAGPPLKYSTNMSFFTVIKCDFSI